MDFSHYTRDTAFGYAENGIGEVRLSIYLGGKNVKNFTQLTGGAAEVQRLQQVIATANLEGGHIVGKDERAKEAQQELQDYATPYRSADETDAAANGLSDEFGEELIMDASRIAEKLSDDTRIKEFRLITVNNYGYENNYTRAHEETEYITESLISLARRKAAVAGHAFTIRLESIVKQGKGTKPGMKPDPEVQIFGMTQDYTGKHGELHIASLTCDKLALPMLSCPDCNTDIFYDDIKLQLAKVAEGEFTCPHCGRRFAAGEVRKGVRHGEYYYKVRDIMNVYISQDDASCISFLTDGCTEDRLEEYLQLAMKQEKRNCVAAFLDYKQKHFKKESDDFLSGLELDDFGFDDFGMDDSDGLGDGLGNGLDGTADGLGSGLGLGGNGIGVGGSGLGLSGNGTGLGGNGIGLGGNGIGMGGLDAQIRQLEAPQIDWVHRTMTFGRYANQPLKWQILSVIDDEALVITDECIDCKNYYDKYAKINWSISVLRAWLNGEFLQESFTEGQRSLILNSHLNNCYNYFEEADCGEDTEDRIFALDIDEAEFYFDNRFLRQGRASAQAVKNRAYVAGTGYCAWWLRTTGVSEDHACNVDYFGLPYSVGFLSNYSSAAVRPAMWMKIR